MTRSNFIALAALLAVTMAGGPVLAQPQQQQPPARQPSPGQQPPGGPSQSQQGPQDSTEGPPWPVMVVTSVEVLRSTRSGGMDVIRARGLVTSDGWGEPHLLPITRGEPLDGVLDLIFQAHAPGGAAPFGPFMVVEAILPVENGHPYKGVRVRGATNAVTLKTLPGFAEVPAPKEDCAKCMGKYFVAKGGSAPANTPADNVVREADLPWLLRIIKPTDGIPNYAFDPNRLTLVLSEDGRIVDGAWD
jgi:hypothetical protein